MSDTAEEKYQFSNVPANTHIQEFGDVIHKLIASAPWHEGDKVAAQQVVTNEFGHPTPFKEMAISVQAAINESAALKAQIKKLEEQAAAREKALNERLDKLMAAFESAGKKPEGAPPGSGQGSTVAPSTLADTIAETANEEAQKGYAEWKAKQQAEKEAQQ